MRAVLRWLFPHYREMEQRLSEESSRLIEMQDRVSRLQDQNIVLEKAVDSARADQIWALRSVANIGFQLAGQLPPYPEAHQMPRRPTGSEGPVASGRAFPRDVVHQATRNFREQLTGIQVVPAPENLTGLD